MSQENAAHFVKKVAEDSALRQELAVLKPEDMNGLLRIASGQGFGPFTRDEYVRACAAANTAPRQLSQQELDRLAGGGCGETRAHVH